MQHFFYPGYTSKRILCAHCDLYFTEMHFENRLVCRGTRPFNYCNDSSAIQARTKIHPEQWKIFIDAYPQFASEAESESYHPPGRHIHLENPPPLPKILVIPESIVPSLQCYKEYNHKAKEQSNPRSDWPSKEEIKQWNNEFHLGRAIRCSAIPAAQRREDYLIPHRIPYTDDVTIAHLIKFYWREKREGYLGDNA